MRNRQEYTRLLADVVYRCPDLEELSGLANAPRVEYEPIHRALLTRHRLKTHVWQSDEHVRLALCATDLPAGHAPWQMLETLVLYQWPTRSDWHGDIGAISTTVCRLPQLKHLMISHYSKASFHNGTLLALPKLQSLRLENLEGLTDQGVEQYVQSAAAWNLLSLSLIDLELSSLHTIQSVFRRLDHLRRFRLVQHTSPEQFYGLDLIARRSLLVSASVEYLHWDTYIQGTSATIIANSIRGGCLPRLRTIKLLGDSDGAVQALCRPVAYQPLAADDMKQLKRAEYRQSGSDLKAAQVLAQLRIRESRRQPSCNVVIQDENAEVQHTHVIGSYLGDMHSSIDYSLAPDMEWCSEALASADDIAWSARLNVSGKLRKWERVPNVRALF